MVTHLSILKSGRRALLAFAFSMLACGCAGVNLKGDNFTDDYARWGEKQRPSGPPGEVFGLSTKAQQIERNLGVR